MGGNSHSPNPECQLLMTFDAVWRMPATRNQRVASCLLYFDFESSPRQFDLRFRSAADSMWCLGWSRGHGRDFFCFCAQNCCQFQSEERGSSQSSVGKAKIACVRVAGLSFLHPRSSHQVSPQSSRGAVPLYSRKGEVAVEYF